MATINFRLSGPEIGDLLRRVTPAIMFCTDEFFPVVAGLAAELPYAPMLVTIGGKPPPGAIDYERFIEGGCGAELEFVARPDDIAYLLFTSGTTGASKCCILGQREMRGVAFTMNHEMRCGSVDRGLINMPMFHIGALAIVGGLHARGGTVVLQPQFDAAAAVRLIAEKRITVLHLAPVMLKALLDEVGDGAAIDSVRTVVYSAAPMRWRRCSVRWPCSPMRASSTYTGRPKSSCQGCHGNCTTSTTLMRLSGCARSGFRFPAPGCEWSTTLAAKYPPRRPARSSCAPSRSSAVTGTIRRPPRPPCETGGVTPATWAAWTNADCCTWWTARRT